MRDQEILKLLQERKYSPAMKCLYQYFPVVKKHIVKNNGSKEEAEDIFQESLIILCNKVVKPDFQLTAGLNTYIYGICKLLWLDELKKKNKNLKSEVIESVDERSAAEISEDIDEDRKRSIAQQAVMQLGQKCKELLELFYFKQRSMKEIAMQLGFATEKVAKNQKYRCIEKAKENLKSLSN